MTLNINTKPDIKISLNQTFGIDSDMEEEAFSKKPKIRIIGMRAGEKIHEEMISIYDSRNAIECKNFYIIYPNDELKKKGMIRLKGKPCPKNYSYSSDNNKKFLRANIRKLLPLLKKYGINDLQIVKSIENLRSSSKTINIYFKEVYKKVVKQKGKKVFIKKNDLFSLNEEIQLRTLGLVIKSFNKSDYPPRSKKILNALKFLNTSKDVKHQLGGCLLNSRKNYIFIEKS